MLICLSIYAIAEQNSEINYDFILPPTDRLRPQETAQLINTTTDKHNKNYHAREDFFNHKEHKAHKEKTLCSLACGRAGFVAFVVQFWLRPTPRYVYTLLF